MSEKNTIPTPGEISADEKKRRDETAIEAAVANLVRKEREAYEAEIVSAIRALEDDTNADRIPNWQQPERVNGRGETLTRTSSPTEPAYRRLSAEEQEIRNPEVDHWIQQWGRSLAEKDSGLRMLSSEKLNGLMTARAVLAEGADGASGAISAGTAGAAIPRPVEALIALNRDRRAKGRRLLSVIQMTAQQHTIPLGSAMTAAMVGESTSGADASPSLTSASLVAKTAVAKASATREALQDAPINFVNFITQRGGGALGVLEDDQIFQDGDGTGNNIEETVSGTTYTLTTATQFGYVDAIAMVFAIAQEYQENGVWMVSSNVLELLSNVRDAANGRPLYTGLIDQPGVIRDDPMQIGTILRKPVFQVPFAAGTIWFGDPMASYAVGSREGITVSTSSDARFLEREVVWLIEERFGGVNTDSTAAAQIATGITSANNG